MRQFINTRDHTYKNLTLEFLSTLPPEVTRGLRCQERYISLFLRGDIYELNLSSLNNVFGFSPSLDMPLRHVPQEFN